MTVQIISGLSVVSSSVINPGISDKLENRISNEYMSVTDWHKDKYNAITVFIRFFPAAHNLTLKVLYSEPETSDERRRIFNNPSLMDTLFSDTVLLIIDPKLEFMIYTKDGRKDGVNNEDIAFISCTSRDGVPSSRPILWYTDKLRVRTEKFVESENKLIVQFYALTTDHNKYVQCSSAGTSEYRYIHVFHHPTKLEFKPAYSGAMPNGSSILCHATDGYPEPVVTWHFISGPANASKYYRIHGNNLTILGNCPLNSRWSFNCSALNSIPRSYDSGATRTFSFIVSPNDKVVGIVVGTLVAACLLLIVIIVLMRKRHALKGCIKCSRASQKSDDKSGYEDAPNNYNNSYYTYPTVAPQESEVEGAVLKKKKGKRKPKKDPLVEDDCIV